MPALVPRTVSPLPFGFLTLFLFGAASVYCYFWVARTEQPADALISNLHLGKKSFDVLYGEICIGGFDSEFRDEPGLTFIARGTLRADVQGRIVPAKIFIGSFFNSLRQLVSANLQIDVNDQIGLLALSQPNPVHARLTVTNAGNLATVRELDFPGPVELEKNRDDSYRLSYVGLQGNIQRMLQQFSFLSSLPKTLAGPGIQVVEGTGDRNCGGGKVRQGGFPVGAILEKLPMLGNNSLPLGPSVGAAVQGS